MSVIVKGMEMPKNCFECVCKHKFFSEMKCYEFPDFEFGGTEKFPHMEDRSHYCPLVHIQPHGRLIDADALTDNCMKEDGFLAEMLFRKVSNAPTILDSDNNVPCKEEVKE